jgi:phospholipase C
MDSRREFIKKAAMLSGTAGLMTMLPESIQKALAINPEAGTTFLDAEHVVILMQENRSFDHSYGTLQGVRGFNDPRAMIQPDKNKVWLQKNAKKETYVPFRLNIHDTKATWMSALPHSWENQVDALNRGKMDGWLENKKSGNQEYKEMPLTMGFYNREDIPYYYAFADAFTICDQNFCSSLTGTTPNRLYLWSGTIREKQNFESKANVSNSDVTYDKEAHWTTLPDRFEDAGISWKVYQNELSIDVGFEGPEEEWLANFTNNPLEWLTQFNLWYSKGLQNHLPVALVELPKKIEKLEAELKEAKANNRDTATIQKQLNWAKSDLKIAQKVAEKYPKENFEKLSQRAKNLHQKAFCDNSGDPDYHSVVEVKYDDNGVERTMYLPKGDVLHQFRKDVNEGQLPTVSYLIAPKNFSDHPGAPWYGAWYISESLDILTKNPEVWKKTVFILCYDENDGYFDHVTPFFPPRPEDPKFGKVSAGIDTSVEMVNMKHELQRVRTNADRVSRDGPIGLGFRVPLVVASPWSRGGYVNSEVFDHTSIVKFLEVFLSHKTGKPFKEENISEWRRTVCGDLTSVFRPYNGEKIDFPASVNYKPFVEGIHKSQFKDVPKGFQPLSLTEIEEINKLPKGGAAMPMQEKGNRPANALPYELYVDGKINAKNEFELKLKVGNSVHGKKSAGAPFLVYLYGKEFQVKAYAVKAGDELFDTYPASLFEEGNLHLSVHGPNGFFREYKPLSMQEVSLSYDTASKERHPVAILNLKNHQSSSATLLLRDNAYGNPDQTIRLAGHQSEKIAIRLDKSFGWYDVSITNSTQASRFYRFCGRVETGKESRTDPFMGA